MVKRRLKSITAAVLVAAMLVTMAPQIVCEAAETAWKIVKNQETPLDKVYFDCKKSDDATKSYLYGYKDGKVAIMDSDYNLVKKTDFDEIDAMKGKVKGKTVYIVSKKIGKNNKFGLMSEKGETVLEPQYDGMAFGNYAITVQKYSDEKYFKGLLSYDDGKELISCKYESVKVIGVKDKKMLITAVDYNGNYSAILDGNIIFTGKTEDDRWSYEFEFDEYNGQKCILCIYTPDSMSYGDKVLSYISYDGKVLKKMTYDEYRKNSMYLEKAYKEACNKWLNKACEDGEKHVQQFYKSNNIMLNDIHAGSYYGVYENDSGEYIKYYLVIVTGNYNKNNGTENIVYSFIYNTDGKCLLSGRSFDNIVKDNEDDEDPAYIYMEGVESRCRYILEDSGWLCYLDDETNIVEKLFEVKSDKFTNMCANSVNSHEDYNINHDNQHYLHYDYGNIIETGNGYSRIFVYADKKLHSYDYSYNGYYFIKNESGVKIYHCALGKKKERELSSYNEYRKAWIIKEEYERKILWQDYGSVDIGINELEHSEISEVDTGLLVNNTTGGKVHFFGKNKYYTFLYAKLGITGDNKKVYMTNVCDCNEWIYFILKSGGNEQYYCLNTLNGEISNVLFDNNNKGFAEQNYIEELGDKLYLYSSTDASVVSIDKKTFITKVYTLNLNIEEEKIDSLLMLDDKVYVQYVYTIDGKSYYGIINLSGNRYISASLGRYEDRFKKYGNYIFSGNDLYDSSINNIGSEYTYVYSVSDDRTLDENGHTQLVEGIYQILCRDKRDVQTSWGIYEEYYNVKLVIVDNNLGKAIYEVNDEADLKYFTHIDNYYVMSIYNSKSKTTERVIIDASTGEKLYDGDGYVYVDESNNRLVIINKKKSSSTPVPTESATTAPTQTPTSKPTESAVPAPTINPTEAPTSTVNPLGTPAPTSTTKPTQIPDGNITEGIIGPSQPTPTVRPTETPVPITTVKPTENPAQFPTITPTESPTATPVVKPVNTPAPTQKPTALPVTISVAKKSVKVKTGKSTKISYSAYNTKGKRVKVKAVSSNTKAAKVSVLSTSQLEITVPDNAKDGAVSKITLTNGKKKTTIKVTVKAVKNKVIKLEAENKKISVTKGDKLSVTYYYNAQNDKKKLTDKVKIKSSDEAIAKIVTKKILNGEITVKIKGVNKGKVDITVKVGSKSATTKVKVK